MGPIFIQIYNDFLTTHVLGHMVYNVRNRDVHWASSPYIRTCWQNCIGNDIYIYIYIFIYIYIIYIYIYYIYILYIYIYIYMQVSASWTQSVRASEQNSMVVGLNPAQAQAFNSYFKKSVSGVVDTIYIKIYKDKFINIG